MMEVMRDLEVRGTRAEMDALVDHMTRAAKAPWARSTEGEANIGDDNYRVFSREAEDSLPALGVALHLEPEGSDAQRWSARRCRVLLRLPARGLRLALPDQLQTIRTKCS